MKCLKKVMFIIAGISFHLLTSQSLKAQAVKQRFEVRVLDDSKKAIEKAVLITSKNQAPIYTNEKGIANINIELPDTLIVFAFQYQTKRLFISECNTNKNQIQLSLEKLNEELEEVLIQSQNGVQRNISTLGDVEGVQINAAKKSERIKVQQVTFNKAVNNARQIFAKVAGLNVWESDRSGGQLNIGARGLSPNRTSNFNVRQNGYDIAADALGYPESYYTPPLEAIDRIDVVRGASSLQYGTQFGGLLNFVFKRADAANPVIISQANSTGSFGLFHNFTEIGYYQPKFDFYGFYQYRGGEGWRPNSSFDIHTASFSFRYRPTEKASIQTEYTLLRNLSQQAGGLTDIAFQQDPRQSIRSRNWFTVNWNLVNLSIDYRFNSMSRFNSRFFGNFSSRQALGNLDRISMLDLGQNRTLLIDNYANIGNESRWVQSFKLGDQISSLLVGFRLYQGNTDRRQGDGSNASDADFRFINPDKVENSDYLFPSTNLAIFSEWVLPINNKWTLTPGVRYENIRTQADGFYRERVFDFAGNLIVDNEIEEELDRKRSFLLFGFGLSRQLEKKLEAYSNFSKNYRAITFSDLRIANPNFVVDPYIQDEDGFNFDVGLRGEAFKNLYFDLSLFYLRYNDRIGLILRTDEPEFSGQAREIGLPPFFVPYRFRTNVANSRTLGIESLFQYDFTSLINQPNTRLQTFLNISFQNGVYLSDENATIDGRQVELVSPLTIRWGLEGSYEKWSYNLLYAYTHEHFSDATNTRRSPTAVNGIIPSYQVVDFTFEYSFKRLKVQSGLQNLFNEIYFTRRADGYPGPGIIPSDPRNWFVRFEYQWF